MTSGPPVNVLFLGRQVVVRAGGSAGFLANFERLIPSMPLYEILPVIAEPNRDAPAPDVTTDSRI